MPRLEVVVTIYDSIAAVSVNYFPTSTTPTSY